jgi:hypothetical protein
MEQVQQQANQVAQREAILAGEAYFGPQERWTDQQRAAVRYTAYKIEQDIVAQERQHRAAAAAAIGEGVAEAGQQMGDSIRAGAQYPYGSGDSGYGSGVILGPNGKTSTYFRNPGGGVILGDDGSITNVIGH